MSRLRISQARLLETKPYNTALVFKLHALEPRAIKGSIVEIDSGHTYLLISLQNVSIRPAIKVRHIEVS